MYLFNRQEMIKLILKRIKKISIKEILDVKLSVWICSMSRKRLRERMTRRLCQITLAKGHRSWTPTLLVEWSKSTERTMLKSNHLQSMMAIMDRWILRPWFSIVHHYASTNIRGYSLKINLICQSTQSKFRKQIKTSVTSNSSSQWYLPTTFHPNCFLQQLLQNKTSDTNNRISHALHQRVISRSKSRKSIMPKKPSNLPNNSKNRSYRVYSHQWTKWKNRAKSAILVNQLYQDWIII